jgi:hypothetical protein
MAAIACLLVARGKDNTILKRGFARFESGVRSRAFFRCLGDGFRLIVYVTVIVIEITYQDTHGTEDNVVHPPIKRKKKSETRIFQGKQAKRKAG